MTMLEKQILAMAIGIQKGQLRPFYFTNVRTLTITKNYQRLQNAMKHIILVKEIGNNTVSCNHL